MGQAETLGTDVPPVIEREAQERVTRYAAAAQDGGRIVAQAEPPEGEGWFCPATLAADLPEGSPVLEEEIFGPLLAVQRVRDVEHACDVVDGLSYALTGGLFTRDPGIVRRVRARSPVGNLYINRGITGAMVARQPFGGNRLSGTGLKAGGPDYLLQFVEQRAVSENTMRHGLEVGRHSRPAAGLTYSSVGPIMGAMPPTVAWKLAFALVLVAAIATSAFARAPRRSADPVELRRLVACALALYAVGGLATLTHHSALAGLVYAAGSASPRWPRGCRAGATRRTRPTAARSPSTRSLRPSPTACRGGIGSASSATSATTRARRRGLSGSTSAQPIGPVRAAHDTGSRAKSRWSASSLSASSSAAMIIDWSRTSRRCPIEPVLGLTAS